MALIGWLLMMALSFQVGVLDTQPVPPNSRMDRQDDFPGPPKRRVVRVQEDFPHPPVP
jgi:hypothetical protein